MKDLNFLGIDKEFTDPSIVENLILPIPFEKTTSYGRGTSNGPTAIIEASQYLELYDEVYDIEAYTSGIATLPPLSVDNEVSKVFKKITEYVGEQLDKEKFLICLGGEHSITSPIFEAYHKKIKNLSIIQFDAHSDLRESYEGSIYSHASVMFRIFQLTNNIVQVGIRSQCMEEANLIRENGINTFFAHDLVKHGFSDHIIDELTDKVYITFDVDYFDPSIMPSTGTPEPGGFQWTETIQFLEKIFKKKDVVGCDVVELSPKPKLSHPDFLVAKLVYKMITLKQLTKSRKNML